MKRKNLRLLSLLLSLVFCLNICFPAGVVHAETVRQVNTLTDLNGHWAESEINKWLRQNLVGGYADGTFQPDRSLTRAEFVALVNRALGYTQTTDPSFSDVPAAEWYAAEVAKAVAAGYISGYPDGTFQPNQAISRQEVAAVLSKILVLQGVTGSSFPEFSDQTELPSWSLRAIREISTHGYMGGYPDGSFRPAQPLTRAEAISLLDRVAGLRYDRAGTYGPLLTTTTVAGNVTITSGGITLQKMVITGDLYLSEGVELGQLTLDNVQIQGTIRIRGGTELRLTAGTTINTAVFDTPVTVTGAGTIATAVLNVPGVTLPPGTEKREGSEEEHNEAVPAINFMSGYPRTADVQSSRFDLLVRTAETGTAYYLLLPEGAAAPDLDQLKAGKDGENNRRAPNYYGAIKLTAKQEARKALNDLRPATTYNLYVAAEATDLQSQTEPP